VSTPLDSRRYKHALAVMIIDASRWGVRATRLCTLAPGFTVAAWISFIPLHLEIWISHCCETFAPEVQRELLHRHHGHDPDDERLGPNHDTATNDEPVPDHEYLHCVSRSSRFSYKASAAPR
jgi:hypothetical protein